MILIPFKILYDLNMKACMHTPYSLVNRTASKITENAKLLTKHALNVLNKQQTMFHSLKNFSSHSEFLANTSGTLKRLLHNALSAE